MTLAAITGSNEPTNTSDQRTSVPVGELMAFDQERSIGRTGIFRLRK
jgi:hypothetical protein